MAYGLFPWLASLGLSFKQQLLPVRNAPLVAPVWCPGQRGSFEKGQHPALEAFRSSCQKGIGGIYPTQNEAG
tara:strand:- start:46009 stop:46224 length:216 start_codon:yes stop_codon:yes gene_type:complete